MNTFKIPPCFFSLSDCFLLNPCHGLKLLLTQCRVPTLAYLQMAKETVLILATTRQSHSNAMTTTVWWEMKQ